MELHDFAQQVLFATSLEEKLRCPEVITDDQPGAPLATAPKAPGRPLELRFKPPGSGRADFPKIHQLEQERERGRLLHFFANHELLATELMALVLLRFPEAPAAFRRGVLQTLKDEQVHTRLYLQRMRECGIQFGELPVSGYFWRAVSPMDNPMDYVSSLSLTFEQANLDFCRYFSQGFETVGDSGTARLLDQIYRDEIAHVASGLKWFRRWKNPQESDWEAFCRQLKWPLSPQRAKGIMLNIEGRRAAGLDPAFIDALNVHAQSKGRTPTVFVFNPLAELAIAQGRSFKPGKHQAMLASDLANIPQFLCRQDDIVLVPKRPSVPFLSGIKQAGFPLPEFIVLKEGELDGRSGIASRKIGGFRPWAWAPDSLELFQTLLPCITGERPDGLERFNEKISELYTKSWSANFLRKILSLHPGRRWLCTIDETGVAVNSLDNAMRVIDAIRKRGHHKIVVKEELGLAGHNSLRLWEREVLESQRRWLSKALEKGRPVVIEPWLERELDFSIQLEMGPGGLKLCGYTGLINDRRGQFEANWAAANHARRFPSEVGALFPWSNRMIRRLEEFYHWILKLLEEELQQIGYLGPLGIDAFVYRTSLDECRLKPVVEINPRYTLGRLTIELMKNTCPGSHGLFRLLSRSRVRAEGFAGFEAFALSLGKRFPLQLEGEPKRKIREGALCLNDPGQAQGSLAVFQVSRSFEALGRDFN